MALWFGLVTGLLELLFVVLRHHFVDTAAMGALQLNRHAVWMIPTADLMILGSCGLMLGVGALLRVPGIRRLATYGFCFLSALALVWTFRGLTTISYVILAAGIASRLAPPILARRRGFRRLVGFSLPVLTAILATLFGFDFGRQVLSEQRALANLPDPRSGAPNVLFIVLDTVRAESLSLHGYARDTSPHLTRLASAGVRFDRARSAASWTLPSHASMFTGHWPHELSARTNRPLDATFPTLAEYLRDHGYATAGFVANTFFCNHWYGLSRGFLHYEDNAVTAIEVLRSSGIGRRLVKHSGALTRNRPDAYFQRKDAPTINRELLDWLDHRSDDRPFLAFLNYYDAHDPYLTPVEPARRFGLRPSSAADVALLEGWHRAGSRKRMPREVQLARDCYDDCIAYLDEQLGRLFAALEARGLLENTVVVVTSDHGEEFGEREQNRFGHGQSLHHEVTHVPLLIVAPARIPGGRVVREVVSLRDLPATLVDLLDLQGGSPFPGRSLAPYWSGPRLPADPPAEVLSEIVDREPQMPPGWRPPCALIAGETLYMRNSDGREELYNLADDPAEMVNLLPSQALRTDVPHCRAALGRLVPDDAVRR
jgi:arylsulfatase A-like enzyme